MSADRALDLGGVYLPFVVQALHAGGAEAVPIERRSVAADGSWWAEGETESWRARAVAGAPSAVGRQDLRLTVTCTAPSPLDAGLRFEIRLGRTEEPGWLIPGCFYGENRPPACTRVYPRFVRDGQDATAMESSAWAFRSDRASTPAVFAWDGAGGAALVTTERALFGESGIGFAYDGGRPAIRLHFPYREEPLRYDGSERLAPPDVRTHRWQPGETRSAELALYRLGDDRHAYAGVLREIQARSAPAADDIAWVSPDEAAELAAWGLHRWHYRPGPPRLLETTAFDREALGERGDRDAMHVSWVSGVPYAYALLRHGRRRASPLYVDAATAVLDTIAENLAPGGTFWAQWTASEGWRGSWHPDGHRLHARTLGDAALFMLRAAADETAHGCRRPGWEAAAPARRSATTAPSAGLTTPRPARFSLGREQPALPGSLRSPRGRARSASRATSTSPGAPASTTGASSTPSSCTAPPKTSTSLRRQRTGTWL